MFFHLAASFVLLSCWDLARGCWEGQGGVLNRSGAVKHKGCFEAKGSVSTARPGGDAPPDPPLCWPGFGPEAGLESSGGLFPPTFLCGLMTSPHFKKPSSLKQLNTAIFHWGQLQWSVWTFPAPWRVCLSCPESHESFRHVCGEKGKDNSKCSKDKMKTGSLSPLV